MLRCFVLLGSLLASATASADAPVGDPVGSGVRDGYRPTEAALASHVVGTLRVRRACPECSAPYAYQTLVVDLGNMALTADDPGSLAFAYAVGAPLLHIAHGQQDAAMTELLARGGLLGMAMLSLRAGDDGRSIPAALGGRLLGVPVVDAFNLSHGRASEPEPGWSIGPLWDSLTGHVGVDLSGRF